MIIKHIVNLCKKQHQVNLFMDEYGCQWISDGHAMYPMENMPIFDEKSFIATYDITEKQRAKMAFNVSEDMPEIFSIEDSDEKESYCEKGPMWLSYGSNGIIPYITSLGIVFINAEHLKPLGDIDRSMLRVYERYDKDGRLYFAVKNGMLLVAIITPYECITEQFVSNLELLYNPCKISLENKKEG